MSTPIALMVLFAAAVLEAGGDALVRKGLHSDPTRAAARVAFFLTGAAVLFAYGCLVNAPKWDFGRLLGVYVAFFFVVAQLINWLVFNITPGAGMLAGGACIVVGGAIIAMTGR
jgi:drug/metabolite transporter superfamily protein YnfA